MLRVGACLVVLVLSLCAQSVHAQAWDAVDVHAGHVRAAVSDPAPATQGEVNVGVVFGGLALALSSYTSSVLFGYFWGGGIGFFVPCGSFEGAFEGPIVGSLGFAFAGAQIIGMILMAAGATFYRHAPGAPSISLREGLSISF